MSVEEQLETLNKKVTYEGRKKNVVLAGVLNMIIAGAGLLYCGNIASGIITFVAVVFLGLILGFIDVITAGFGLLITIPIMLIIAIFLFLDGMRAANRVNQKLEKEIMNS